MTAHVLLLFSYPELLFLALQNTVTVSHVWKAECKMSAGVKSLDLKIRNLTRFQMFSLKDRVENKLHQWCLKYIPIRIMLCIASRQLCSKP